MHQHTTTTTTETPRTGGKRGFASMTPQRRREVARLGGKRAHELGTGHRFTSEEAQRAGKRGGRPRKHPFPAQKEGA